MWDERSLSTAPTASSTRTGVMAHVDLSVDPLLPESQSGIPTYQEWNESKEKAVENEDSVVELMSTRTSLPPFLHQTMNENTGSDDEQIEEDTQRQDGGKESATSDDEEAASGEEDADSREQSSSRSSTTGTADADHARRPSSTRSGAKKPPRRSSLRGRGRGRGAGRRRSLGDSEEHGDDGGGIESSN